MHFRICTAWSPGLDIGSGANMHQHRHGVTASTSLKKDPVMYRANYDCMHGFLGIMSIQEINSEIIISINCTRSSEYFQQI